MSNFNKVILVGRLTRDPELRYTPQGTQIAKFGLAVNRVRSKTGQVDFFNIVAWQRLAELCAQYLRKGRLVLIEGEIQTRRYETQDGQKRTAFEIRADNIQFLGRDIQSVPAEDTSGGYQSASSSNTTSTQKTTNTNVKKNDVTVVEEIDDLGEALNELDVDDEDMGGFDMEEMPF